MSRNRKMFVHGTMVDVSFRAEEGLPLPASLITKAIVLSALARAQELYGFTLCHFSFMSNHPHIIGVVEDPGLVPLFFRYFKTETAHAVNRILGRRKHTVWCDGYDSPIILDLPNALKRIVHAYLNAPAANLERTIDAYPHVNSWQAFLKGGEERTVPRIRRPAITALPSLTLTLEEQLQYVKALERASGEECTLFIEPDAWMECFDELNESQPGEINQLIVAAIRQEEKHLDETRSGGVIGAEALQLEPFNKPHTPQKHGPRNPCLSSFRVLRVAFLSFYREHCAKAPRLGYGYDVKQWLCKLPPGLFAPGGALAANLPPWLVPTANTFPQVV